MSLRAVVSLGFVLTLGAAASAGAARLDPPYDDDLVVAELATHEFDLSDETDLTLPTVRCAPLDVGSAVPGPHARRPVAVVLKRHHLRVEGREVMSLSDDPTVDLTRRSSGTTILPLAGELEYQGRVATAAGAPVDRADLYVDETMPFSAARSLLASTPLPKVLVVRDVETSRLRWLGVHPYPGLSCLRSEFTSELVIYDRRIVSEDGVEILTFDRRIDTEILRAGYSRTRSDWDMAIHVIGDPPLGIIAAVVAQFDHGGSGEPNDRVPIVHLDLRPSAEIRHDVFDSHRRCHWPMAPAAAADGR